MPPQFFSKLYHQGPHDARKPSGLPAVIGHHSRSSQSCGLPTMSPALTSPASHPSAGQSRDALRRSTAGSLVEPPCPSSSSAPTSHRLVDQAQASTGDHHNLTITQSLSLRVPALQLRAPQHSSSMDTPRHPRPNRPSPPSNPLALILAALAGPAPTTARATAAIHRSHTPPPPHASNGGGVGSGLRLHPPAPSSSVVLVHYRRAHDTSMVHPPP